MKKIYKYHYNLYLLYKKFEDKPFYTKQAAEEIAKHTNSGLYDPLGKLRDKGLIYNYIKVEENKDSRRNYHIISENGWLIINKILNNKYLLTKYLLRS
jgi:hypothetical protein